MISDVGGISNVISGRALFLKSNTKTLTLKIPAPQCSPHRREP